MSRYTSSKSTNLLKDNSWIKRPEDEDEDIDRDPNYGKSVLSHSRSNETLVGSEAEGTNTSKPIRTSTSVHALTKRFSASQDDLQNSNHPSSRTPSYTRSISTSNTATGEPKSSTKTTTVTQDGTTETTITTTTQTLRSSIGSPTQTFTDRVRSSSKGSKYSSYSPTKTTKVTETTITSNKDSAEDKLYDTLIPSSITDNSSPTNSKRTVSTTEIVTVKSSTDPSVERKLYDSLIPSSIKNDFSPTDSKTSVYSTKTVRSSPDLDGIKTTTVRTSSMAEDELYDTLLPRSITSPLSSPVSSSIKKREIVTVDSGKGGQSPTLSSPSSSRTISYSSYTEDIPSTRTTTYTISTKPSEDYSSEHKTSPYTRSDSSYEYSSITSPTVYTTSSYKSSRSDEIQAAPIYSRSSITSVYASPERTLLEKDLCTYCHRPFNGDAKMVLDDMKINCHASCFKCEVCNSTLGHMKAGDCLWIYRRMVHCENCFDITREKWRH